MMSAARYDVVFTGQLRAGVTLAAAKQQLQTQFKLSDAAAAHLLSGERVVLKRGADEATALHYRGLLQQAGAIVELVAVDDAGAVMTAAPAITPPPPIATPAPVAPPPAPAVALTLAPPNTPINELPPAPAPVPDISHLSLVQSTNWTLEDCTPPPVPQLLPDIDALALEPLTPVPAWRDD